MAIVSMILNALMQRPRSIADHEALMTQRDTAAQQNALLQMQMQRQMREAQRQAAGDNALKQYGMTEQAANALMQAGDFERAARMSEMVKARDQEQRLRGFYDSLDQSKGVAQPFDPVRALAMTRSPAVVQQTAALLTPQKKDAIIAKPGEQVLMPQADGSLKPVFSVPEKADDPSGVKEYKFAQSQGYKGSFEQWQLANKRAGANSVNLAVNTAKGLTSELAQGLGKQLDSSLAGAQSAIGAINTARQISSLVDSGKVVVGPFADKRVAIMRVGEALGVTGANDSERLANTAALVKNLAQSELDAAQQMKGQGQITEAERAILKRAAAGDINMSPPELKTLAGAMEKTARSRINAHQQQVQKLRGVEGAAPVLPFYQVDAPPEAPAAPKPSGGLSPQEQAELEALRKRFNRGQ